MKLSLLSLVGYLVSSAVCFGEYGAYERALYWYAYDLDARLNERPTLISTGCTDGMPKRVKRCNFQQWLEYMDNSNGPTRITADISGMSVDRLAQELQNHRYTGKYTLHRVIHGISETSGQMPTLFKQFSLALVRVHELATGKPDPEPSITEGLDKATQALSTVEYLRSLEFSSNLRDWLRDKHGIDAVTKGKQWPGISTETREFFDARATQRANKDKDIRSLIHTYAAGDEIHPGPIEALREAKNLLGCL